MKHRRKLGIRIVAVVALSIFAVEAAIGYFSLRREKREAVTQNAAYMGRLVSSLGEDWARSIREQRFERLTDALLKVCRESHAHAFVLFEPGGEILAEASLTQGYKARQAGLKERLRGTGEEGYRVETLARRGGDSLWFLAPLRGEQGEVVAGLSVEWPSSGMGSRAAPLLLEMAGRALLTAGVVTAIIMAALFYFVAEPIRAMSGELEDLSKGEADLTFQMKVRSQDEIGEMAQWFNSFLGKIRAMVLRVMEHSHRLTEQVGALTHSTNEVSAMSEDVTTTIQQIARGAEEQASKIAEVNHLMQEAQELMKQVERKAQETAGAAERATQTARAGGKMAQGTIDKMVELNGIILKNSGMVGKLGSRSREIGKVVEIISGIAEQTNLLSLNAAIEAARAGEQGRGFAVVAEEIRTLADGSAKAVQEITGLVQEIQDATGAVVESMEKSAGEAEGSRETIRRMEASLGEIVTVVENVAAHSKSITELLGQQAQRYAQVVHGIQDINAVSEESAASTEEVSASTQEQSASMEQVSATCREIAGMAEELKSMVEKFKVE